jgi:uncharacterized damage-inducible protein DinB
MDILAPRYRRLFDYEKDSHRKVLVSLEAVPADLRATDVFQKAVDLMAHLVVARRLWLYRFGVAAAQPPALFPERVALDGLQAQFEAMEQLWDHYLSMLTDDDVGRVFEYRSMEGDRYRNTIDEILTQLYGHSLYHRGQIALLLRQIGAEPAATDFVFWARQAIS